MLDSLHLSQFCCGSTAVSATVCLTIDFRCAHFVFQGISVAGNCEVSLAVQFWMFEQSDFASVDC